MFASFLPANDKIKSDVGRRIHARKEENETKDVNMSVECAEGWMTDKIRQSTALEIEYRQSKKDKTYRYHRPHIQSLVQYYAPLHLAA
jgi:hypothetical protein